MILLVNVSTFGVELMEHSGYYIELITTIQEIHPFRTIYNFGGSLKSMQERFAMILAAFCYVGD
jgi:hypothetical protein